MRLQHNIRFISLPKRDTVQTLAAQGWTTGLCLKQEYDSSVYLLELQRSV